MKHLFNKIGLTIPLLALVGCSTTLTSKNIPQAEMPKSHGNIYYLPKQTIQATITYELITCTSSKTEVQKSAVLTALNRIDGKARFEVPLITLSSGTKTTSLTVATYDDGVLKSIGATVDDKSAEIIGGAINAAGSIARLATGTGASGTLACNPNYIRYFTERETLINDLRNPRLFSTQGQRAAALDALNRLSSKFKISQTIYFTPDATLSAEADRISKQFNTSPETKKALGKWFANGPSASDITGLIDHNICILPGDDGGAVSTSATRCSAPQALKVEKKITPTTGGVNYRQPKRVKVIICNKDCNDKKAIIGSASMSIAQLGDWREIKLDSGAFEDKSVSASWTKAGLMNSLTYGSSSSLEAVASTLSAGTKSVLDTVNATSTTETQAINAELALIKAQADLIEQRNRLETLTTPEIVEPED